MKLNKSESGITHILLVVLAVVVLGAVGFAGWKVYNSKKKTNQPTTTTSTETQPKENNSQQEPATYPEGWVLFQDSAKGISFYHPVDWDKSKFKVHKVTVSETIKGTNHGRYSAKYVFKKAENNWYAVNASGNLVAPSYYGEDTIITKIPASIYQVVYGWVGEGGGVSYYVVFTDGKSSFLIEFPVVSEEYDPDGLNEQKQAAPDLVASIQIDS